jgi:hypothetical protein
MRHHRLDDFGGEDKHDQLEVRSPDYIVQMPGLDALVCDEEATPMGSFYS